ncbi:hypothetical protein KKF34_07345 [Myxococcota bacterium]|nr:hypothetical protein [Myxococcota bacterium]MBU1382868.1 hypothetical protein [Myxococcota bacterium]MBU1496674.1 hypothetical protein [Myxococcota bacterium]
MLRQSHHCPSDLASDPRGLLEPLERTSKADPVRPLEHFVITNNIVKVDGLDDLLGTTLYSFILSSFTLFFLSNFKEKGSPSRPNCKIPLQSPAVTCGRPPSVRGRPLEEISTGWRVVWAAIWAGWG